MDSEAGNDHPGGSMRSFFYVSRSNTENIILNSECVLISAATLWDKDKFILPKNLCGAKEIFLDSGGFSFFTKWEEYPFSTDDYCDFIMKFADEYHQLKYVAVMDYPCEDFVNRTSLGTNKQRIGATIQNTKELLRFPIPAEWVAVVQGYSYSDYRFCCELMKENNLFTKLTAVGSICTRKKESEILAIIKIVSEYTRGIHAFGLEYQALKNRHIWETLYSSDSSAWKFFTHANKEWGYSGYWRPRNTNDKILNFIKYREKINALFKMRGMEQQRWENLVESIDGIGYELTDDAS